MSRDAADREVHLIDIENLFGGTSFTYGDVESLRLRYELVAVPMRAAQFVVATSGKAPAVEAGLGWDRCRLLFRCGTDGADLALVEVAKTEHIAQRFNRIVIGSGDGIFAAVAAELAGLGCHVVVVSRRGGLSRRLAMAATEIRYIDDHAQSDAVSARWSA